MKGYVSLITLFALPVVWLVSGAAFRGLKHPMGRWWAAFLILMLLATPFSIWKGGSVIVLMNYIPRSYLRFFFIAALAVSFRDCRRIMYVNAVVSFLTLLTCIVFGSISADGRYFVPGGAGFFSNSNELAMQLLMGITQFAYMVSQRSVVVKLLAALGILGSIPYMLWTGSRGCTLGAVAYGVLLLYTTRHRVIILTLLVLLAGFGLALAPSAAVHRLALLIGNEPDQVSADESTMSRIELLQRSVTETLKHPLFGVGPGQFPVAVSEEAKEKGVWAQWLGTHNAYTQVSSECGIPAAICYSAVIVLSFLLNLRIWKSCRNLANGGEMAALSVALLSGTVVYAVCSFFFHMAYTDTLPMLAGQTLALYFVAQQQFLSPDGGFAPV